jgi:hypothetical protein
MAPGGSWNAAYRSPPAAFSLGESLNDLGASDVHVLTTAAIAITRRVVVISYSSRPPSGKKLRASRLCNDEAVWTCFHEAPTRTT